MLLLLAYLLYRRVADKSVHTHIVIKAANQETGLITMDHEYVAALNKQMCL